MKKMALISYVLIAMIVTIIFSCQKDISEKNSSNSDVINKINTWLNNQKVGLKQFKAENIDILKKNLDYPNLQIETSNDNEQIVIVPITEKFKQLKINDKNSIPNMVLILNKSGNIRWGSVILFKPEVAGTYRKVPDNAFYDLFNTGAVKCNGQFQILSPAGQWQFQLNYKDGNLKSSGQIQPEIKSNTAGKTNTICINWYLITSVYINGVLVYQTSEYVGTTCSEQCGDGSYQSLCPDGSSGGGAGTNDVETSEPTSELEEVDEPTDDPLGPPAPKIGYQYHSLVSRTNGYVSSVIVYPTTISNNHANYLDRYNRNTTRILTVFGHANSWTNLGTTALCYWS